jgi:2-polyprenyl-3-methyl-5-hydroxy-6-metoxy-1,4-benzoquinol methylase
MTHIDLLDFRKSHTEVRYDMIREALPVKTGSLLDIGANWGFFCRKFEQIGFTCTAAEHDPEAVHFMKKLKRAEHCNFNIIEGDILAYDGPLEFDVVFALSIFHHFMATEELDRRLINFLGRLKTKYMIFEPNLPGENIVKKYAVKRGGEDFVQYVLKHSCLTQSKQIGTEPETRRPIYLLS